MKKIVVIMCSLLLLAACTNKSRTNTEAETSTEAVADMHTAENALDIAGVYKGTLPAADCPGINVTLTLNTDKTFTSHWVYIDREGSDLNDKGTYSLDQNMLTLKIEGGQDEYYKVGENKLYRLDGDKQVITGPLADNYILTKE